MLTFFKGALLDEVPAEGDALKMNGSAMVALASSKEEVLEKLKNDVYAKSEVWDFSKASLISNARMDGVIDMLIDSNLPFQMCLPPSISGDDIMVLRQVGYGQFLQIRYEFAKSKRPTPTTCCLSHLILAMKSSIHEI